MDHLFVLSLAMVRRVSFESVVSVWHALDGGVLVFLLCFLLGYLLP